MNTDTEHRLDETGNQPWHCKCGAIWNSGCAELANRYQPPASARRADPEPNPKDRSAV